MNLKMRRILSLLPVMALTACAGGNNERLFAYACESISGNGPEFSNTLEDIEQSLNESVSLTDFYNGEYVMAHDKKTGQLYTYDEFEEAFVPFRKGPIYPNPIVIGGVTWDELKGNVSKDGKKFKIVARHFEKDALSVKREKTKETYILDVDTMIEKHVDDLYCSTDKGCPTKKCMKLPVKGVDVHWVESNK